MAYPGTGPSGVSLSWFGVLRRALCQSFVRYRYADGKSDRYSQIAAEPIVLKVEVLVTGSTPATKAAKNLTKTIPIVMAAADPVGAGLVSSHTKPVGNVTGLSLRSW
jgi:putative ABC transport system substrate-binding protein